MIPPQKGDGPLPEGTARSCGGVNGNDVDDDVMCIGVPLRVCMI